MYSLEKLEQFARLLHDVQRVKRVSRRPDEQERTNTAEHTFSVAMMAWYITSVHDLKMDREKILKYALAHDVIEAYAGDTYIYDEEAKKTKDEREAKALARLEKEFPEFSELTRSIHEYEKREDDEARFVYALDKLVDPLDVSMEKNQSFWKEYNVSFDMLIENKEKKIALSDTIFSYWKLLIEKLNKRRNFFFME